VISTPSRAKAARAGDPGDLKDEEIWPRIHANERESPNLVIV